MEFFEGRHSHIMPKASNRISIFANIGKFKVNIFEGGLWIVYPPFATANLRGKAHTFSTDGKFQLIVFRVVQIQYIDCIQ